MSSDNVFQRLEDWAREHRAEVEIDRDDSAVWRVRAWDFALSFMVVGVGRGDTLATAVAAFFDDAKEAEVHPSFSEAVAASSAGAASEVEEAEYDRVMSEEQPDPLAYPYDAWRDQ